MISKSQLKRAPIYSFERSPKGKKIFDYLGSFRATVGRPPTVSEAAQELGISPNGFLLWVIRLRKGGHDPKGIWDRCKPNEVPLDLSLAEYRAKRYGGGEVQCPQCNQPSQLAADGRRWCRCGWVD